MRCDGGVWAPGPQAYFSGLGCVVFSTFSYPIFDGLLYGRSLHSDDEVFYTICGDDLVLHLLLLIAHS